MSKSLSENIGNVRIQNENGDLVPILDDASEKFRTLVKAVADTGKAGSFTMKIDIKPSTAGALATRGDVVIKPPKGLPAESLLWPTPEGNLISEDPKQGKLSLKSVPDTPVRDLKVVSQ